MKLQRSQGGVRGGGRTSNRGAGLRTGGRARAGVAWAASKAEDGQESFQRLVSVQETERRRLARELHDEIGQALTVIQLNLQAVLGGGLDGPRTVGVASESEAGARLTESLAVVDRVLEQVRDISLELRPSMLDELGLEPALSWYLTRQAAVAGFRVRFEMDPLEGRLESALETECFRIVQEAVTNVVRHARAREVVVQIRCGEGQLRLAVWDDGVGFDVGAQRRRAVRGSSLGLLSMEERAAIAGGRLEIRSVLGAGTRVEAWLPLLGVRREPGLGL